EWTIGHAWRACVPFGYRGFESHPLRHFAAAQALGLLALLLFDRLRFVRLVDLAVITGAKLLFCFGLRLLRLVERFVELLLGRAERPSDGGQDILVGLDRRWAGIYGCRGPVNLAPP